MAREIRDVDLKEKIMEVWEGEKGRKVYGARKIWLELNSAGDPRCQPGTEATADDAARRSCGPAV